MLGLVKAVRRRHRRNAKKSLDIWALTLTYANQTQRPSAEQMLKAFCHITLYFLPDSTVFVTPINLLQKQILAAMNFPQSLYLPKLKPCPT